MAGRRGAIPALITSARVPRSLDADERNRRYLVSMTVRVLCFLAGCFAPFPANIAFFVGAAIIPGFAVILANAVDRRTDGVPPTTPTDADARQLPAGLVVPGDVDPEVRR
nr:DUF3099 domain-containing protein [Propionibacterium sp.]